VTFFIRDLIISLNTVTGWWFGSVSFTSDTVSTELFTRFTLVGTVNNLDGTDWDIMDLSG
jgi:hypothetical protein